MVSDDGADIFGSQSLREIAAVGIVPPSPPTGLPNSTYGVRAHVCEPLIFDLVTVPVPERGRVDGLLRKAVLSSDFILAKRRANRAPRGN